MNIVLIYPFFPIDRVHIENIEAPPIGLHYLAALLREQGYDVELLNWHNIKNTPQVLQDALRSLSPDLVGFSIFHANRWGGIQLAKVIKERFPMVPIVFGGIGATFLDTHLLGHFPWIDLVVRGEGEITFPELVRRLDVGECYDNLPGLSFRSGNTITRNEEAPRVEDLDSLPMPAAHYSFQHLALSRGCPGKCTFCGSPGFWGPKVRFHSAEYFVAQIELLYKKGQRFFHFSDDTFTLRKKLVLEICTLIRGKALDITWAAISRVDCIDEEMLKAMRMAGCIQISFGVESGSENIRKVLNKKFSEEQIRNAFAMTVRYGILARAYIIYGCPGESEETVQDTLRLLRDIRPLVTLFHVLALFPGTALYEHFKAQSGVTDDIWLQREEDLPYFEVDTRLSAEAISSIGKTLKQELGENIPDFFEALDLVDDEELFPYHAAFLSRLALTLDRGDYPHALPRKTLKSIAGILYDRALHYAPDARAYWGLSLLAQDEKKFEKAKEIIEEGLKVFPYDPLLAKSRADTLKRLG